MILNQICLLMNISSQIKNAVCSAQSLIDFDKTSLSITHVWKVLDVERIFENDFKGTRKIDNINSYLWI